MNVQTVNLFFALLTVVALVGTAALIALALVRRSGRDIAGLTAAVPRLALPLAWCVAVVATLGSLYESEIAHFTPCKLCWFQRIAMYPLAVTLGIATVRRDRSIRPYVLAHCAIGGVVAIYHSFIQWFPPEGGSSFCTVDAPCTERYVWELGFITLPFMALTAFAAIAALTLWTRPSNPSPSPLSPELP